MFKTGAVTFLSTSPASAEKELLMEWFEVLVNERDVYKESYLDEQVVEFVKFSCDTLRQDSHVFIMSVDILEEYLEKSESKANADPLVTVVVVIFICSKFIGDQSELRIKHVQSYLTKMLNCHVSPETIRQLEVDVLNTFQGKLPLTSKIDDLNTFLEIYIKPLKLKVDIQSLCVEILNVVYMSMKNLFAKLKKFYSSSDDAKQAFRYLIVNKLYLPSGIALCAIQMTKYKNFIDLEQIIIELCEITKIHDDHLRILTDFIIVIVNDKN